MKKPVITDWLLGWSIPQRIRTHSLIPIPEGNGFPSFDEVQTKR